VAHAEASAKTVDAAVTAAAAQLGLRSDQVDIEVLEDPVPSTFGFIGSPARVRVTSRSTAFSPSSDAPSTAPPQVGRPGGSAASEVGPASGSGPGGAAGSASPVGEGGDAGMVQASTLTQAPAPDRSAAQDPPDAAGEGPDGGVTPRSRTATRNERPSQTSLSKDSHDANRTNEAAGAGAGRSDPDPASVEPATPEASGPGPALASTHTGPGRAEVADQHAGSDSAGAQYPSAPTISEVPPTTAPPSTLGIPDATGDLEPTMTPADASPSGAVTDRLATVPTDQVPDLSRATRPSRRTYRDEPIEPEMVEADTERAGDFLEGLLDALDVDGDITTWVDEVGGHIDLEGSDLSVLVGSNGETLDALQELTRLAVLRQSKRRVRLLLDINGFRARQRKQLISIVQTTVEQVLRTREEHEFQPMTPAERKVVHDAVAAIDGVSTESLGEEPNRRVIIRPA
jgi:spoIIIJ-associated protein